MTSEAIEQQKAEQKAASPFASSSLTKQQVLDAELQRCKAMVAGNTALLDQLLDARLRFCHATGAIDDKSVYLNKMASGRIDYISIDWSEEQVTLLADSAILSGKMITVVKVENVEKKLINRVLSIWTTVAPDSTQTLKLIAFQSTPIKVDN